MSVKNDGGPAFPVPDTQHPDGQICYGSNGMSLRDWFAGQALAGMTDNWINNPMSANYCAEASYRIADAMLRAREGVQHD